METGQKPSPRDAEITRPGMALGGQFRATNKPICLAMGGQRGNTAAPQKPGEFGARVAIHPEPGPHERSAYARRGDRRFSARGPSSSGRADHPETWGAPQGSPWVPGARIWPQEDAWGQRYRGKRPRRPADICGPRTTLLLKSRRENSRSGSAPEESVKNPWQPTGSSKQPIRAPQSPLLRKEEESQSTWPRASSTSKDWPV